MDQFWEKIFWGNTVRSWAICLGIILGSLILLRIFKSIVLHHIKRFSARTRTSIDDFLAMMIEKALVPFLYFLAIYAGLHYLKLPERTQQIMHVAIMVIGTFFFLRMITSVVSYAVNNYVNRQQDKELRMRQARGILLIINIIIWALGLVFLLDNLGYDITAVIAGLGIGGIAIALAAQSILGDLFSYFIIFFDKPFEIGDFIIVDDKMGTVEHVGLKTTRLKALSGEQLVFSNTDLTNSRLHNYKRMAERRILFKFGVLMDIPIEKLARIPEIVKQTIESQSNTRFDRAHFQNFGDFSYNYEVVYFVLSSEYNVYMDLQQAINLDLLRAFEKENIGFAYPTQTILIPEKNNGEQQPEKKSAD